MVDDVMIHVDAEGLHHHKVLV